MLPAIRRPAHGALFAAAMLAPAIRPADGQNSPATSQPAIFDHEHILGTSLHLEVRADAARAREVETKILAEIERMRGILSTYDPNSEINKLKNAQGPVAVSPELRDVVAACEKWRAASKGAFHPGVAILTDLWRAAEKAGKPPADKDLADAVAKLKTAMWKIDAEKGAVTSLTSLPFTVDALAKGYIIEKAAANAAGGGLLLEIGGDLRATGTAAFTVAIVNPKTPAENTKPICKVNITNAALATSGGYARGFDIQGKHYSHIFDPRTGRPVEDVLQATVIARDATTADALATILNILKPAEGLALVEQTPGAACLIIDSTEKQYKSREWSKYAAGDGEAASASAWKGGGELAVELDIQQPETAQNKGKKGGYRRPYVAVWVETPDETPVKTLCLWMQKPKWIEDLKRWSHFYKSRRDDVQTVTRATRAPGHYELTWDGRNDAGDAVPFGKYTIYVEAAREHGTYQIMKKDVTVDGKTFQFELDGGVEIKSGKVSFRKAVSR
ncbi:MAG: DUF2271 domain-containing protein [Planctomycetes bacterium]|nr:DUF2271 domain-containing protein [Planctomycetota bacterium]